MKRIVTLLLLSVLALPLVADPVKFSGSVRLRSETWSFFEAPGYDDDYTYFAALLRGSVAQQRKGWDWQIEAAAPVLANLPDSAVAPAPRGQLGFGGTYFAANDGDDNVAGLFVKQAFLRLKPTANDAIRFGRFEFIDGTEVAPKNATLAGLKNTRIAHRLIGNFGFTHVGRSFDGVQYAHNTPNWNVTAAAIRPTVGAFDVEGMDQLDVNVLYGSLTFSRPNADERLFVIGYQDERNVVKVDNRPAAARSADTEDIKIVTIGGHYLAMFGNVDVLLWGAYQTGDWGVLEHEAHAIDLEAGYRWNTAWKPTVRAGLLRTSGDSDRNDGEHETFFQILPTARLYARFPFFNSMNSTDAFVQVSVKPNAKLSVGGDLHLLSLTEENDLWYSGGGAFEDQSFGFAGRTSNGNDDLAQLIDLNIGYALNPKTDVTLYLGAAKGGDVIDSIFTDDAASFVYLEFLRRF